MKLAVFDFDSTLMDGETLEFLARQIGIASEIKSITDRAMQGELDFFEKSEKELNKIKNQIGVSQEIDRFERDLLETKKGREIYQKNRKA